MTKEDLIRLNKYLADMGIASRRKADEMILQGRIAVNSEVVRELGTKINPNLDVIEADGNRVDAPQQLIYIVLNKPTGVISSVTDPQGRKTVTGIVGSRDRLYPVGRLDEDSQGLILLTNDGNLAHKLTHPKFHIPKVYEAAISGQVKQEQIDEMRKGVKLEEGMTAPAQVREVRRGFNKTLLEITLFEGKKRQIRRMCATLHLHVLQLRRIQMGPIKLGDLEEGKWRNLTREEVELLMLEVKASLG